MKDTTCTCAHHKFKLLAIGGNLVVGNLGKLVVIYQLCQSLAMPKFPSIQ